MLEAPRELDAWALDLFCDPPKELVFRDELPLGTCRLPILFPPLLPRFAPGSASRGRSLTPGSLSACAAPIHRARLLPTAPLRLGSGVHLASRAAILSCGRLSE